MIELESSDNLLAGYLSEDWDNDYSDPWAAVEDFVRSEPLHAPLVRRDIATLLQQTGSDADLHSRLRVLGLGYQPLNDEFNTYRQWLLAVADRVDQLLGQHPASQSGLGRPA